MRKEFIYLILFLFLQLVAFSQLDKYSISNYKKGYLMLTNNTTKEVKFKKCKSIDTIPIILENTDDTYRNFITIRTGKKTTLFNTQNDKIIFSGEFDAIQFMEIPDAYDHDSILPKKMVIHVEAVKKEIHLGMNLNVKTGKIISLSKSSQFNYNRSLVKRAVGLRDFEVIDLNGKIIVAEGELLADIKKVFIVRKNDSYFTRGKVGVIDTKGDTIIPLNYRCLDLFADNYFFAWDTLEKHCGIINMYNKVIVPFEYIPDLYIDEYVSRKFPKYLYSDYGVAVLSRSKKIGDFVLIDTTNTVIVKEGTYNEIESLNDEAINRFFAVTAPTGLMGIYDVKVRKESIPCEYSSFGGSFSIYNKTYFLIKGVMTAEKSGRWGLLNLETGKIIIPFEYDTKSVTFVKDSVQDYFQLKKNGKIGIIDFSGRTLLPLNYDEINETIKGFIIVKNNGLYGLIDDKTKKEVLPTEYSKIIHGVHYENNKTRARWEILVEKIEGNQLKKGYYSRDGGVKWD